MSITLAAPGPLPIVLAPMPGEALDSYLEAYARRLHATCADLLAFLGLGPGDAGRMTIMLRPGEQAALSAATGTEPQVLSAMTLERYDQVAVTIDPRRRALIHPPAWRRHTGSRFCPACLHQDAGRWQLAWRLPWAFACLVHRCLLTDFCPACGRRPRPHRPGARGQPTTPGTCTLPAPGARPGGAHQRPCGYPLASAPALLISGELTASAARRTAALIEDGTRGGPLAAGAVTALGELHGLASKTLAALHTSPDTAPGTVTSIISECGGRIPLPRQALSACDAHTLAVLTTLAVIAHAEDPAGQELLTWIARSDLRQRRPAEAGRLARSWQQVSSEQVTGRALQAVGTGLRSAEQLRYRTSGPRPGPPSLTDGQVQRRIASLPALIWPGWGIRLIPASSATTSGSRTSSRRAALAALTLIPGTRLSYQQAAAALGGHAAHRKVNDALAILAPGQRAAVLGLLTSLAGILDTSHAPIDYTRRRALFSHARPDAGACARFSRRNGWPPPSTLQMRILGYHLVTMLTGAPPAGGARTAVSDRWNPLLAALPEPAWEFTSQQAHLLLAAHSLHGEPLTWTPPPPPAGAPFPGTDPTDLDLSQLTAAVQHHGFQRCAMARISEAAGISKAHIHAATALTRPVMTSQQWTALARHDCGDLLTPAALRQLYEENGLTITELAWQAMTTEDQIRGKLRAAGSAPYTAPSKRAPITAALFTEHYTGTEKTVAELAVETGYSKNTLRAHARRLGIPFGRSEHQTAHQ